MRGALWVLLAAHSLGAMAAELPPWLPMPAGLKLAEVSADERYGEAVIATPQQP